MNNTYETEDWFLDGEKCPVCQIGILRNNPDKRECTCFISAPCSSCMAMDLICDNKDCQINIYYKQG